MATDIASFAQDMRDLPNRIDKANRLAVNKAALSITTEIRNAYKASTGGDSRLSGVGRGGARVGARYDVRGTSNPTALIRATGPAHFLERPTSPHRIEPRARRRARGRRAVVVVNGHPYAHVDHPGSHRPSKPWERGVRLGVPEAVRVWQEVQWQALQGTF